MKLPDVIWNAIKTYELTVDSPSFTVDEFCRRKALAESYLLLILLNKANFLEIILTWKTWKIVRIQKIDNFNLTECIMIKF